MRSSGSQSARFVTKRWPAAVLIYAVAIPVEILNGGCTSTINPIGSLYPATAETLTVTRTALYRWSGFRLRLSVRMIAIALLVLAVGLRFVALDSKVYWHDEVFTSTVITARPGRYMIQELFQHRVVKPADLLAYNQFVPELTLPDMVSRLSQEDVQHPPLYYLLLRGWAQVWGTAPAMMRSFSALLSLLIFPAVYWLCLELFESRLSSWLAIALFAISPFHLVYAQEAREYSFWTGQIILSSVLLLRALRLPGWRPWVWYGLAILAAIYTALFTVWVAIGHFVYTVLVDPGHHRCRPPWQIGHRTRRWLATLSLVLLLFSPWAYRIVTSTTLGTSTSWAAVSHPLWLNLQFATFNFSRSFVDFDLAFNDPLAYGLTLPVLLLQGYAVYVLWQTAPNKIRWFILTLIGGTALALGLPDLLFGGQRLTVTRYLIPCFVGLQLAVVWLLNRYLMTRQQWKVWLATAVLTGLIGLGVISCGVYAQVNTWWNKVLNTNYHQVAEQMNQSDRPLIVVDGFGHNSASMIALSYLLKPETQLLLLPAVGDTFPLQQLPPGGQTIFLVNLPESFRQQFEAQFHTGLSLTFEDPWNQIWRGVLD